MAIRTGFVLLLVSLIFNPAFSFAQSEEPRPLSRTGIGIKFSLLGAGVEAAVPVAPRSNLRVGVNAFSYDRGFHKDGVNYGGH